MQKYRKGIVAVLRNSEGRILLCERSDIPGAWQFPQGGIEKGEEPHDAFYREVEEELGNGNCKIVMVGAGTTRYEWPRPKKKNDRIGQEHTWFLAEFKKGEEPDLKKSDHCFRRFEWVAVNQILSRVVDWKHASYKAGLVLLGLEKNL
jgi:putative (di)nucleoside polyphosphate hydrolase